MQLVEVRPLKPFVGSYKCALSEADIIDDAFVEKEDGSIAKERSPRKRFRGLVAFERQSTKEEYELWKAGQLPDHLEVVDDVGRVVRQHPPESTVKVPQDVAEALIGRGVAALAADPVPANGMRVKPQL